MAPGLQASVRRFHQFNGRPPRKVGRIQLEADTPLIEIGPCPELHYISRKEGGKPVHYVHEVDRPGMMYAHPEGKYFVIIGGSTKIGRWLQESNPVTVLSVGNLERAMEQFLRLTPATRRRIKDPRRYIAAVAWEIQRSRLGKLGHR